MQGKTDVGRNNPCPCGSGKKYKKCCLGAAKEVAFINYKGQAAVYPVQEAGLAAGKLTRWLVEVDNKRNISVNNGLNILLKIYDLYDGVQSYFNAYYSCAKGCCYCCYPYVGASLIESELTKKFINDNFSSSAKDQLAASIRRHKKEYLSLCEMDGKVAKRLQAEYYEMKIPCPFLSKMGECMIYIARPFACRALTAYSDPKECKYDRVKEHFIPFGVNGHVVGAVLKLSRKVFGTLATVKHFPAWFIDGFTPGV